jgi:hypothetical protein
MPNNAVKAKCHVRVFGMDGFVAAVDLDVDPGKVLTDLLQQVMVKNSLGEVSYNGN